MERTGAKALACTALQTLIDLLYIVSDLDFQRAVWLRGDHPMQYVSSYTEANEMFIDNLEWLLSDDIWRYAISESQIAALRMFGAALEAFYDREPHADPSKLLTSPAWKSITSLAAETLQKLGNNACRVKPTIAH